MEIKQNFGEDCLDLSEILAASMRQHQLIVLSEKREIHVMQLVNSAGSTYKELNRNRQSLELNPINEPTH